MTSLYTPRIVRGPSIERATGRSDALNPASDAARRVTPAKQHAAKAIDFRFPFTRAAALKHGFDPRRKPKDYQRLLHGVYLSTAITPTPLMMARAVLLTAGGGAWASHATAARLLDLPIPALPGEHVTVSDSRERRARSGLTCHYAKEGLVIRIGGATISAPAQVFVELATQLTLVDLVVIGDHMVFKGMVSVEAIVAHAAKATGPGASLAREAAAYVRAKVESPMETRLRMLMLLAGLPEPEINEVAGDEPTRRRYDLSYRQSKTIIEYDGRQHIERVEQWESDLTRREAIDEDRWRILVFIAKDIYRTPANTLARIHRVLRARRQPGVPAKLSDAWRPHFPGW